MRKIKLSLEGLAVESFETVEEGGERHGTVQALELPPTPALSCICSEPTCVATNCQIWVSCVEHCA